MATITKKEMIDRIAASSGEPHNQVKDIIQQFLDAMIAELSKGNRLEFRDFGVFETRVRHARTAQNPKTLTPVSVPEKHTVKFKVGRKMKRTLGIHNDGDGEDEAVEDTEIVESSKQGQSH